MNTPTPSPTPDHAPAGSRPMSPGDLAELLSAFNDITGRLTSTHESLRAEVERLQGELTEANGQLERSRRLAALGQMAAGIAHEVRNPLGSIRLYARMLTQDLEGQDGPRTLAEKIGRCAAGLEAIVGDVLNFSREFTPRAGENAAGDLFDAVLESVCHDGTPGWREVEFRREGGQVPVHADPALIRQALVNLARNAVEAAREGAGPRRVTLAARRAADGGAELRVRDSGPGIPREVLARLFNPFFTTRASGTGLGLAIVHRIVDAHGGRVVARNAPGGGAEFAIHLPPARTARGSSPDHSGSHSGSPTPTITITTRTDAEVA